MNQELIRMQSLDGIELPGILYCPEKPTNRIVIHVHGLSGNFYENRFIDTLAKVYTEKGYSFLTFNNRGKDYISELLKGEDDILGGACYELFEDCLLDLEGVVSWVKERNYKEIFLEGHSYGCNKVIYYYHKKSEECIKKIILLAPCDIPREIEIGLGEQYEKCKEESKKLVEANRGEKLIDFPIFANGKISAKTFYSDFYDERENDLFCYRDKNRKNELLESISIPILIVFGDQDECVLTQPKEKIISYFTNRCQSCKIEIIENADHSYQAKEHELGKKIQQNI